MFEIGDVIMNIFCNDVCGVVIGYGVGNRFSKTFCFGFDEPITLMLTENNTIIPIRSDNADYVKVSSFDMSALKQSIKKAKEKKNEVVD